MDGSGIDSEGKNVQEEDQTLEPISVDLAV
jgi:hypothetical protein